jgi:tetratricopeptide (TPR) repeat protein
MNRRERRIAIARGKAAASAAPIDTAELVAAATAAYRERRLADAEVVCKRILSSAPAHVAALNVLGLVYQASGRHRLAVRTFAAAIAADALDAACHYNIACSYQALEQSEAAAAHFKKAIALGLSGKGVEQLLMRNAVIAACVSRVTDDELARGG